MTYECWSLAAANALDVGEMIEGYFDGMDNAPEPGSNRSPAYRHGWWAGASDKGHVATPEWLRAIAHQVVHGELGAP